MKPSLFEPTPSFDAPEGAPTRTKDGEPWTRWGHSGNYEGWYAIGSRPLEERARPTFWEATFYAACQWTGGNLDQAHCCGPGILSLGGLGVTIKSGFAQVLLHECLIVDPERFLQIMAPVIHATGAYTKRTDKTDTGIALFESNGKKRFVTEKRLREVVMLGSDGLKWSDRQKKRAQLWVSCCSKLLRDARMDAAQAAFAEHVLPALLTEPTREILRWPRNGMRDSWQYTQEQQALWSTALVMGLEDAEHTEKVIGDCVVGEGRFPDAEASLGNIHRYAWESHPRGGGPPGRYGERLRRVLLDAGRQFRVESLGGA